MKVKMTFEQWIIWLKIKKIIMVFINSLFGDNIGKIIHVVKLLKNTK